MNCRRLNKIEGIGAWWHRLWCKECRSAHKADAVIARGVRQWQETPAPTDSLSRTLAALGIVPTQLGQPLSPAEIRSRLGRALLLVGLGIFIMALTQPETIGRSVLDPLLTRQGLFGGAAGLWALIALFSYLKPLAAMLTDYVPLFGSRRRSYLVISAGLASLLWLTTLLTPNSPAMLTIACIGVGAMLALGSTVIGGFLVEQGQKYGATGRLGALHQMLLHLAWMIAAPLSGFLAGMAFHLTPIFSAALLLILAFCSYGLMREETSAPPVKHTVKDSWNQVRSLARSRTMWSLAAILILVFSVSNFSTVLSEQQAELGFTPALQSLLEFTGHAASLAGIMIYLLICRRYPLQSLLIPGIIGNALGTLLYLGYHPHLTPAEAVAIEIFNGMASALIAVTLFDLAVRAVPVGSECLGYAILMSVINISSRFSDLLSVHLMSHYHFSFAMIVGLSAGSCLLAALAVPFLPREVVSRREGEPALPPRRSLDAGRAQSAPV